MNLQAIFENDFGKAEYDSENLMLYVKFRGMVKIELSKEVFTEITKFIVDHKIIGGAIDCMEMKGAFTKLNSWFNTDYFPIMQANGYKCWSMATTDVFSKYAGTLLINMLGPKGITAKVFGDFEKAKEWTLSEIQKNR